jgi:hypothetical protein
MNVRNTTKRNIKELNATLDSKNAMWICLAIIVLIVMVFNYLEQPITIYGSGCIHNLKGIAVDNNMVSEVCGTFAAQAPLGIINILKGG